MRPSRDALPLCRPACARVGEGLEQPRLGALGGAGVSLALSIIARELDTTMALCDLRGISEIGPQSLETD